MSTTTTDPKPMSDQERRAYEDGYREAKRGTSRQDARWKVEHRPWDLGRAFMAGFNDYCQGLVERCRELATHGREP